MNDEQWMGDYGDDSFWGDPDYPYHEYHDRFSTPNARGREELDFASELSDERVIDYMSTTHVLVVNPQLQQGSLQNVFMGLIGKQNPVSVEIVDGPIDGSILTLSPEIMDDYLDRVETENGRYRYKADYSTNTARLVSVEKK